MESVQWNAVVNYSRGFASLRTCAGVETQIKCLFECCAEYLMRFHRQVKKNNSSVTLEGFTLI